MTKTTFGEYLKREREMRGVSLEEISSATRIGMRFLEALENEQWNCLPGGVFNRGFVRAVARFLGLDEENLVAEYALATNDRPQIPVWTGNANSPGGQARWLPWLAGLLAVVLAGGGWLAWHHYTIWRAARWTATSPAPSGSPAQDAQAAGPAAVPETGSPLIPSATPAATAASLPQARQLTIAASSAGAAAGDQPSLELSIAAGIATTVSVVADGKGVFDSAMSAGERRRFQAQEWFEVSAGNSGALLLELNGQTMAPMGPPGSPGKIILTRKDLKKASGGPD